VDAKKTREKSTASVENKAVAERVPGRSSLRPTKSVVMCGGIAWGELMRVALCCGCEFFFAVWFAES
jgi:hypothetical protein